MVGFGVLIASERQSLVEMAHFRKQTESPKLDHTAIVEVGRVAALLERRSNVLGIHQNELPFHRMGRYYFGVYCFFYEELLNRCHPKNDGKSIEKGYYSHYKLKLCNHFYRTRALRTYPFHLC